MDILISAPPYTHRSGGIRVLHYLGYLSDQLGHNVEMTSTRCNPMWGKYSAPLQHKPDIKILPEIDPASEPGGNVVRWVLYFPGQICGGPKIYPKHELVVSYHEEYDNAANEAATRKPIFNFFLPFCHIPPFEHKTIGDPREKTSAVWYGKGPRAISPEELGATEITREWPKSRIELLTLLQNTETIYSFDKHTALNDEALLCGCRVWLWDGVFKEYINPNASIIVMDPDYDIVLVDRFLAKLANIFGIWF